MKDNPPKNKKISLKEKIRMRTIKEPKRKTSVYLDEENIETINLENQE